MLVEESRVDVEDQVADDVEAEVARTRSRRRGSGPTATWYASCAVHRRREPREGDVVVDERPERLVPVEADAVEIVRLALVPAGGGGEVDDRRHRAARSRRRSRAGARPSGEASSVARRGSSALGVAWRLAKRQPSASAAATASR